MAYPTIPPSSCSSGVIPTPFLFGAEIISLAASPILNFTGVAPEKYYYNHPTVVANQVNFCNITVTYTHPGQNDVINIETWLPLDTWNGRLQAVGGGGWTLGRFPLSTMAMTGAIGQGYVTTTTDAGIRGKDGQAAYAPDDWVLVSEGNINLYNVQNFASVSLNDQAIIAKALIKSFYGQGPEYSYWSGCSQGGRQGMMLAQRYPHAYDGIAAAAPAISVLELFAGTLWAQVTMLDRGEYPAPCEFNFITSAVISFCDPLDGIIDGLISDESLCQFDPMALVGESFICPDTNKTITLSETAAVVAKAAWTGPRSPMNDFIWYGPNVDSRLSGEVNGPVATQADLGYAQTKCQNETCTGVPVGLGDAWFKYFMEKNSTWSWTNLNKKSFAKLYYDSVQYQSILGSNDPDLSEFHAAGGKIITYHGMADGLIPLKGTVDYYSKVQELVPHVQDFYRLFEVPGLAHCSGGNGGQPTATWDALLRWVENGTAPDTLPISLTDPDGVVRNRILCPYPQKSAMKTGFPPNSTASEAWECR